MKENFNKFPVVLVIAIVFLTALNSCVKNRNLLATDFSNIPANLELLQAQPSSAVPAVKKTLVLNLVLPSITQRIYVNYAGQTPAPQDITVKLALDQGGLSYYNSHPVAPDTMPYNYQMLSSNAYTFNPTVVIKKGTYFGYTDIVFYPSRVNPSLANALSVNIVSSDPAITISANYAHFIYLISVKSPYEAVYTLRGYSLRAGDPVLTGPLGPTERTLYTQTANSVRMYENRTWSNNASTGLAAPLGNPIYIIDPVTNAVTVTCDVPGPPNLVNNPNKTSRYDPVTRTIYAYGTWGGGPGVREMNDTLKFLRETP